MIIFKRSEENPVLIPNPDNNWEGEATFNGCPAICKGKVVILYRAESLALGEGVGKRSASSIGYAASSDGIHFKDRHQFIRPEFEWEQFGCEDPRVTKLDGKYYIFYTALSKYPFQPEGIRVGLAITKDFKKIEAKHPVTNFNAKAMALFPERVNGKMAAVLAANTDKPPVKIALAYFDDETQIWSENYWTKWYDTLNSHAIPLERSPHDQIEVGAPPIKTKYGWLLVYSHIQNYFSPPAVFGIEAALLNINNPAEVIGRTKKPLLISREEYERYGRVPNVVFPSGAIIKGKELNMYYGAADTTCAMATIDLDELLREILGIEVNAVQLKRFFDNPIITPNPQNSWEAQATFNPGVLYEGGRVHIVYRAMSRDNTSVMGYASSADGTRITERLPNPIYVPSKEFEAKLVPGGNSGCEDPRLTRIEDEIYMCYTAFNGKSAPRVALTHITLDDFLNKQWKWADPVLISPPDMDDKDAAIFPRKIKGKYAILHRLGDSIWIDFVDDLNFDGNRWIYGQVLMTPTLMPRVHRKIGIAGPPIETPYGWLLLCHGVTVKQSIYDIKAALLGLNDPLSVIGRTYTNILEPETDYEKNGIVNNVVFSCGAVVIQNTLYFYYGGGDKVTAVATVEMNELLEKLKP
jgi:beta-1,2-mannobiose phosphorylase / 1,2-beta-oligomannan phosphorylase